MSPLPLADPLDPSYVPSHIEKLGREQRAAVMKKAKELGIDVLSQWMDLNAAGRAIFEALKPDPPMNADSYIRFLTMCRKNGTNPEIYISAR